MAKVAHKIRIKAPRADLFEALSTVEGLTGWYTPHLDANVAKGNEVTFRFAGREPFRWKITELSPTSRVRWDCIERPRGRGWNDCNVSPLRFR
jgi:uncharacterized protein YndB with AHSA1/START domain